MNESRLAEAHRTAEKLGGWFVRVSNSRPVIEVLRVPHGDAALWLDASQDVSAAWEVAPPEFPRGKSAADAVEMALAKVRECVAQLERMQERL